MDFVANFNLNKNEIEADFEVNQPAEFDAVLEINPSVANWGNITGNLSDQTDLQNALDLKADKSEVEEDITTLDDKIDNVQSDLSGDISALTQTVEDNNTAINNRVDGVVDSFDTDIEEINTNISNIQTTVSDNYTDLNTKIQNEATTRANSDSLLQGNINTLNTNLTNEINARTSADSGLQSQITQNATDINSLKTTINDYGDIVSHDATDFATSAQGALADTALQPNDNITELNNNAGYITSASLPTVNNNKITIQKNSTDAGSFTLNQSSDKTINLLIPTQASDINAVPTSRKINNKALSSDITLTASDVNALSSSTTINDLTTSAQQDALDSGATSTNIGQIATNTQNITNEVTNRQNADNNLQSQIDAIVASSDVFDIVGTYAELQVYDISTVPVNDIIKVLVDSTHSNAATYYRCVESGGVKSWSYIGSEGAYYTKSEADSLFVEQTTTVNGKALSNNITLTASDVGALPDTTTIPTKTSDLTNDSNFATVSQIPTNNNQLTNGAGYITSSALNGYATENFVTSQGYITGISSSDVTTALGYTPYNSTNPNGYQANVIETIKVNGTALTPTSKAVDITVPSAVTESTVSGWGFTKNVGTVTSVNNTQPVNGNVTISIPDTSTLANKDLSNLTATGEAKFQKPLTAGDGIEIIYDTTWTTAVQNTNLSNNSWRALAYNGTKFVALSYSSYVSTSADGTTWTTATQDTNLGSNHQWNDLVYDGTKFVALGISGYISTSTDGTTWTTATNNLGIYNWQALAYDGTKFVALGATGYISISIDGTTWTTATQNTDLGDKDWWALVYDSNNNKFVAIGLDGYISTSIDNKIIIQADLNTLEQTSNKVTSLSSSSTDTQYPSAKCVYDQLATKQATLVSGTSIKTINNTSLLGSGNIQVLTAITSNMITSTLGYTPESTSNKITSLSSSSTDTQYPSAKCVYDELADKTDTDLSNLSSTGQKVIDGQWVQSSIILMNSNGTKNGVQVDLSSYLPNDGYNYDVKFKLQGYDDDSSYYYHIETDIFDDGDTSTGNSNYLQLIGGVHSRQNINIFDLPVGTGRYIKVYGSGADVFQVLALGYRRIGTNS